MSEPETPDMFPETLPQEVEITDRLHILKLGEVHGFMAAVDLLRAIPEAKRTPGFNYAIALVEAESHAHRADIIARNIRVAAKAGVDVAQTARINIRGYTLIVEPFPPGEEA